MIYHLALADEWGECVRTRRAYTTSTVGVTLEQEGFIHCSYADQVHGVAERFYAGRDDVLVLTVDPTLLTSPVRVDVVGSQSFPHVYGPLDLAAVVAVELLQPGSAGSPSPGSAGIP